MRRRGGLLAGVGLAAALAGLRAQAQVPAQGQGQAQAQAQPSAVTPQPAAPPPPAASPMGQLKSLGENRYQVGSIVIDKPAARFVVPGRILVTGRPLEYLAASPNGMKGYETMLELDATGSEFNLACILIGLERDPKQVPLAQFRRSKLVGPRVGLFVSWFDDGKPRRVTAAEALLNADSGLKAESIEWVYTGSPVSDGAPQFAADRTGMLIGFVHDVYTVIEAVSIIGPGAYGMVRGHAMLPPVGTAIELSVEAVTAAR